MVEDSETRDIEENVPEEGPVPVPAVHQMKHASQWCHFHKAVLNNGSMAHRLDNIPEGVEEEDYKN